MRRPWTDQEDRLLAEKMRDKDKLTWQSIAQWFPHRTVNAVRLRWTEHLNPEIEKGQFSEAERQALLHGVQDIGVGRWSEIQESFLPNRTPRQIASAYQLTLEPRLQKRKPWTEEEDALIMRGVELYGHAWTTISWRLLPHRNRIAIHKRYVRKLASPNQGPWTNTEDDVLLRRTILYGADWAKVAEGLTGRSQQECSERYRLKVEPALYGSTVWHVEEDKQLLDAVTERGSRWSAIARDFPDKSAVGCRKRFWDLCGLRIKMRQWNTLGDPNAKIDTKDIKQIAAEMLQKSQTPRSSTSLRSPWTPAEDDMLLTGVAEQQTWETIAAHIPHRTKQQCKRRYMTLLQSGNPDYDHGTRFSTNEEAALMEGVHMFGHDWQAISKTYLPHRTPTHCMKVWHRRLNPAKATRLGAWTAHEDTMLTRAIDKASRQGQIHWPDVASFVVGRTPRQCRLRYETRPKEGQRTGRWTGPEEIALAQAVYKVKDKQSAVIDWRQVAANIGNTRTPWSCMTKYGREKKAGSLLFAE
ncbi:hypothetical protein BZG36_00322 [Bifiguratus adelaidae]|uniref:Homeodomain-like protein n=1 Tax=Bifiguratus adelaidae TaxID=1938954 RepID=A0A261Y899_9FUNG|nr:hypothetical protein BZG36_00322 [Bifiguratus adelaidae]